MSCDPLFTNTSGFTGEVQTIIEQINKGFAYDFPFWLGGPLSQIAEIIENAPPDYPLAKDSDYVTTALGRLLKQFDESPLLQALVTLHAQQYQDLEDVYWDLSEQFDLDTVVGFWLELLGKIVGQLRLGISDDDLYRALIKARIVINRTQGRDQDINKVITIIFTGGSMPYTKTEIFPAGILLELEAPQSLIDPAFLFSFLVDTKAAGVRLLMVYPVVALANSFVFADNYGTEASSTTQGFASTYNNEDSGTGGTLGGDFAS